MSPGQHRSIDDFYGRHYFDHNHTTVTGWPNLSPDEMRRVMESIFGNFDLDDL